MSKTVDRVVTNRDNNKNYTRHFNVPHYLNTSWLTECSKLNTNFCWPCILFTRVKHVWSRDSFVNLTNLSNDIQKQERSQLHISSVLKFKMFQSTMIDLQLDEQDHYDLTRHNEMVKTNRAILNRFIDRLCIWLFINCYFVDTIKGKFY